MKLQHLIVLFLMMPALLSGPACSAEQARRSPFNRLVWADEFNGSRIDLSSWSYETTRTGWDHAWNSELQDYRDDGTGGDNAFVREGCLVIKAIRVNDANQYGSYTSARLTTKKRHIFQYGRITARMKLPVGQGSWPAFWMIGDDIDSASWPRCGEIDIMELAGGLHDHNGIFPDSRNDWTIHGTLHGQGYSGDRGITGACSLPGRQRFDEVRRGLSHIRDRMGRHWHIMAPRRPPLPQGHKVRRNEDTKCILEFRPAFLHNREPGGGRRMARKSGPHNGLPYVPVYRLDSRLSISMGYSKSLPASSFSPSLRFTLYENDSASPFSRNCLQKKIFVL